MGIVADDDDDDDGPSTESAPGAASGGTRLGGIGIGIGIGVWGLMVPTTMPVSVTSGISPGDGGLRFMFSVFQMVGVDVGWFRWF
jgi:hypothetical protein